MSLIAHLDILRKSLAKKKEKVKLLVGPSKHKLQNIINRNEINIEHLQKKIDHKKIMINLNEILRERKHNRVLAKQKIEKNIQEKQYWEESLKMQLIDYLDDGTIPWE